MIDSELMLILDWLNIANFTQYYYQNPETLYRHDSIGFQTYSISYCYEVQG
jgi:hypothetical protein